jgi:hypothetical protein
MGHGRDVDVTGSRGDRPTRSIPNPATLTTSGSE